MPVEERICSIHDLEVGQVAEFDLGMTTVCLARFADRWVAVDNSCTYAPASLAEGSVDAVAFTVSCRDCGSVFSLLDGRAVQGPAELPEKAYPIRIDEADVLVVLA